MRIISCEWRCKHVCFDVVIGSFMTLITTAILFSYVPPAYALSIPVGNLFVLDLGDLPPWIAAFVALAIWWDARKAKKNAAEAAALAAAGVKTIGEVAVKVDGLLEARDKAKVAEGIIQAEKAGVLAAEQLAEGQRRGIEIGRAGAGTPGLDAGNAPVPVADDKNIKASERVAAATERMAEATESKKKE